MGGSTRRLAADRVHFTWVQGCEQVHRNREWVPAPSVGGRRCVDVRTSLMDGDGDGASQIEPADQTDGGALRALEPREAML